MAGNINNTLGFPSGPWGNATPTAGNPQGPQAQYTPQQQTPTSFPQIPTQGPYTPPAQQTPTTAPVGVFPQASYLYQHGGPQPYPGFTQSWFSPLQEQGYGTSLQGLQAGVGQAAQNQALAHSLQGGFNQYLGAQGMGTSPGNINKIGGSFNPWNNPALDASVQGANQALTRDFNQGVMPQIGSSALGAGQFGSSRHGVQEGLAKQGLADAMSRQTSGMYQQGFDSGMNRYVTDRANSLNSWLGSNRNALSAWQMAPQMAGMTGAANTGAAQALQNLGTGQATIGGYYQGMNNSLLAQQQQQWDAAQNRPYNNLNWYSSIINGQPAANQAGTQTQQGSGSSWLPSALGIGAAGYGMYQSGMFGGDTAAPAWQGLRDY